MPWEASELYTRWHLGAGYDGEWSRGRGGSVSGMTPVALTLVGVPTNSSGTVDGVARAPAVLRQRGLAAALACHPGFTDAGDLALPAPVPVRGPSGLLAEDALVAMIVQVAASVAAARHHPYRTVTGTARPRDCRRSSYKTPSQEEIRR